MCGVQALAGPQTLAAFTSQGNRPAAPCTLGPHLRVVEHATFAQCLNCFRQSGLAHGSRKVQRPLPEGSGVRTAGACGRKLLELQVFFYCAESRNS
eukprot:5884056-Amphidinium_carterae.2